jgi:glycosyltransferase involved in cell wall biosynthesis
MLSQFFPPVIGGEERHVYNLSVELARRGHSVAVVSHTHPSAPPFELIEGVRVYRINGTMQRIGGLFSEPERRHAPPFPDPETVYHLRRILDRECPDIVHAHNWLVNAFLPLKYKTSPRLILSVHDYSLRCPQKRLMYRGQLCSGPAAIKCLSCTRQHYGLLKGSVTASGNWLMQVARRKLVDRFLPVSHAVAQGNGLAEAGVPFEVIPNFVPDDIADVRSVDDERLRQLPDQDYLLFVGDLTYDKGVGVLLEAYRQLDDAPPLVLIGRRDAGLSVGNQQGVTVLENWPHRAVMQARYRSIAGLVPSLWAEPFSTASLESMAVGRPVIGSRMGGLVDQVIDGETGFLVEPGSIEALRQAIQCLLSDPARRTVMGSNARRRAAEFYASAVVPRIEQVYQMVLHA